MKPLALGMIEDLRRRKLLPVALLLVVALVALPVFALKSAPATPADPAATPSTASVAGLPSPSQALASDKPLVTLAVLEQASTLDAYTQKDPFKPLSGLGKRKATVSPLASAIKDAASQSDGPSLGGGSSDSSSSQSGSSNSGSADAPSSDGTDTTSTETTKPPEKTEKPKTLTYALDVTLRGPSRSVSRRALPKLSALPNATNPLLIYLGIDDTRENAVFLVDASLKVLAGEGTCSPSPESCGTLKLKPGEVEEFRTETGDTYRLQIDQIRTVSADAAASAAQRRERSSSVAAASAKRAGLPAKSDRRFVPPVITDLFTGSAR